MKCIFEASSGLEAHMIFNLLEQQGIIVRIDGEYLQGGIGELQAMNMVRVLVGDADYTKAEEILNTWNASQIESTNVKPSKNKSSGVIIGLLFGLLFGIGSTYLAYNSPTTLDGIDHNDDGTLDETWIYKDNRIYRSETDRNLDGKIDAVHKYNRNGLVYKSEIDDNFDGIFESIVTYSRNNPILQESDLNNDGKIDYRILFDNGVFYETEIIDPSSNIPIKKQTYKMNKLTSSQFDSDGDGSYDKTYKYDYYEEIKN